MYFDTPVAVPDEPGKITFAKKSGTAYVCLEYDRVYDPVRKFTIPKRVTIGKLVDPDDRTLMLPNENFAKRYPLELPEDSDARRKEELWAAALESNLSYEEILAMVKGTKSVD